MARPYTIQAEFQADFRKLESEANKFGNRFGKVLEQALEVGSNPKITASLEKYLSKQKAMAQRLTTTLAEYEYRVKFKTAQDVADEQQRLNQKIADAERDLAVANLNDKVKAQRKAEKEEAERQKKVLSKDDKQLEKRIKTLKNASKAYLSLINKAGKPAQNTIERIARGQKLSEEYAERFRKIMNASGEEFVETVEGGLERLSSSLRGSIDLGSMIKGGTGTLSKGLGGVGDMLAGIGAGGGEFAALATTLGAVATVAGALVGVFGVFAAVMFSVDKEVKDFNKSAISTFGSRSAISYGLDNFRHAVQDLTNNLGLTEQEATGLFDALDQGGFSLQRITKGIEDVADRNRRLNDTLQKVVATSKALGVSVGEFTNQATEMANTYGDSLEGIIGQFASIGKMAQEAGFSTRRFYSLVVQATSSQAGLNTRVAETAEILTRMSKILGDKQAAGFLEQMGGSFEKASSTDLMKIAAIAGVGDMRGIAKKELASQSRVFLGAAAGGGKMEGLQAEAAKVGITSIDINNPEDFARQLADLETGDRNRLISSVTRMDSGLGRRLEDLTRISENVDGGLTELPEAMRTFSAGGVVQTYAEMANTFGVKLDDMNAIQRTAFANATGLSEEQITQMQRLARNGDGTFRELQALGAETTNISEEQKEAMLKQYGAYAEGGKVYDAQGTELVNAFEYLTTAEATNHLDDEDAMSEDMALAYKSFDETVAIGDILGNQITNYLRGIYEDVGIPLIGMVSDLLGIDDQKEARDLQKALSDEIRDANRDLISTNREISEIERKKEEDRTAEEKTALETARGRKSALEETISELGTMRDRAASGDVGDMIQNQTEYSVLTEDERSSKVWAEIGASLAYGISDGMVDIEVDRRGSGGYATREAALEAAGGNEYLVEAGETTRENTSMAAARLRREAEGRATAEATRVTANAGAGSLMSVAPATEPLMSVAPASGPLMSVAPPTATTPPAVTGADIANFGRVDIPSAAGTPSASGGEALGLSSETTEQLDHLNEVMEASGEGAAEATKTAGEETIKTMENEHEETRKHLTKVLTKDVKLGNALARSELPQAIVDAQVRQQLMSLAFAAGMTNPEQIGATIDEYFTQGTFSDALRGALTTSGEDLTTGPLAGVVAALGGTGRLGVAGGGLGGRRRLAGAAEAVAGASEENAVEDFVYRGDGVRGTITPIDERDTFVGMKPGGAIDRAVNGGGSVTVNIYGGDERRVYDVVKRVLQQSGIGPSRVAARA